MIQLGITDFLLDLILDWDDIEDYTMYVPEGPEYEKYDRDAIQPVVAVSPQPSHEDTADSRYTWRSFRFPTPVRGLRVSVDEAERFEEETPTTLEMAEETARMLVWAFSSPEEKYERAQR